MSILLINNPLFTEQLQSLVTLLCGTMSVWRLATLDHFCSSTFVRTVGRERLRMYGHRRASARFAAAWSAVSSQCKALRGEDRRGNNGAPDRRTPLCPSGPGRQTWEGGSAE